MKDLIQNAREYASLLGRNWDSKSKQSREFINALITALEAVQADAARLEFIQRYLFGHRWNGVIDSGSKTTWDIWSGYRHITATMVGDTFREAIDAAIAAQGEKP